MPLNAPDRSPEPLSSGPSVSRRTALIVGTLGVAGLIWGTCCPEDKRRHEQGEKGHHANVDALWQKNFVGRMGNEWLGALRENAHDPRALQAFVDRLKFGEGLVPEQARILCSDGRNCPCGSCSAGSLALVANQDGSPRALRPGEIAQRILQVPAIVRTKDEIEYTDHDGCGGRKIAMSLLTGRPMESITKQELSAWGTAQGEQVVAELNRLLGGGRRARFRTLDYRNGGMDGDPSVHDEDFIAVTALSRLQLDRQFPRIPKHMQVDLTSLDQKSAILHIVELTKILTSDHGPGHTPIPLVGLGQQQFAPQVAAVFRELERALPKDLKDKVLLGTARV